MSSFPKGWFLMKNLNNGYVLSVEKSQAGEPVVIASIRTKDIESQLWQYGEDGRIHNKKTGFVLDIEKGDAKAGSEVVLQNDSSSSDGQTFGLSSEGHIHLLKDSELVLGIKESFFTRREGQHVHLQLVDKKDYKERKEQRWELIVPSKRQSVGAVISGSVDSLKRTISGASLGSVSTSSVQSHHDGDSSLDDSAHSQLDQFPEGEFFIKSESTGYFVGVDAASLNGSGSKLCLEPLRKTNYESQLWHYDIVTNRLFNKGSDLALSAEDISDDASVCQSSSTTEKDLPHQAWALGPSGSIRLKKVPGYVLGFKDNWFNLNREGAQVLIQKTSDKVQSHQKFVFVLPIFKKKTTEIVSATEQIGVFPEGYFFIKNQKHNLVVSVLETEKLAAQVVATKLDAQNYNRQLWTHKDGFLINKASEFVLDVRDGCISSGSEICQYKQKKEGYENQQWGLTVEGFIHSKTHKDLVLALDKEVSEKPSILLAKKKTPDHEEQRWNFVLPVFKQVSSTVKEKTVQKSVQHHQFAQYPSGWFFIRSFVNGGATESPLVLSASNSTDSLSLKEISKEEWRYQLWMNWNGVLINFATQLAIDVHSAAVGSAVHQELRQANSSSQKWYLTTEGYLVHGSNAALSLIAETSKTGDHSLLLGEIVSVKQEHRWGLLTPEIKVEKGTQLLANWKVALLTECKKSSSGQYIQKVVTRLANWPEDTFFITAHEGLALVPEKSESYSQVVVKKLHVGQYEQFKWTFRDGYLVHVATGLALHASDDLVGGSELQIREQLLTDDDKVDRRQQWLLKTDGSIISEAKTNLGFALLKQNNEYQVELAYASKASEHYNWGFVQGHYETRYSDVYKKEMTVLSRTERILLTVRYNQASSNQTKLVTRTCGVLPKNWFFVRSKADSSLVLTAPDEKEGSKLRLSKIDHKNFRHQLWHTEDGSCIANLASGYVIDVAGGALNEGSNIIQYGEKFFKSMRKNQMWGLSVDGHLHPQSRPGLVLAPKYNKALDGSEIQLSHRGALDAEYQRWTFAIPVFGRASGQSTTGVLDAKHDDVFIEKVNETTLETTEVERYERTEKTTIVRRWGLFPREGFFIRASSGDQRLALTVEKKARADSAGRTEYEVTLRPIDFKEYKWHFWTYQEGHLINSQTGLALDATPVKGVLLEEGLRTPLYVREKSMSPNQFWSLSADGEIYLRSNQHFVVGASNSSRISVSGAQVGIRELRVHKFINDKGQQEVSLKSEQWLRWSFSIPVFGTKKATTATEEVSSVISTVTGGLIGSDQVIEDITDQTLEVKQSEESSDDYSPEVDSDDDDSSSESEDEETSSSTKQNVSITDKLNLVGNLGIATAGASILAGAASLSKSLLPGSSASAPSSTAASATLIDQKKQQEIVNDASIQKAHIVRSESFHLFCDYVPTGYEKVVRYKSHQKPFFPTEGYFMIKSYLHGHVLDVADGDAKDGSYVVLAPIKTTNFASQLWSYSAGRLVNLKGHNLVLDASLSDNVTSGERVVISTQKASLGVSDQHWDFDLESGVVHLQGKRNLVLSVKELKNVSSSSGRIDVYIQEEKTHKKSHFARAEQRWEIKIPALIPTDQKKNETAQSHYKIVEEGRIVAISSSVAAVYAFEWLKETFHHKMTVDNQWPSTENWFFIRLGRENSFLSAGTSVKHEVTFAQLTKKDDHKRFLWAYVNGYLVNYKYMLRLVFDNSTNKLSLSSATDTLNQVFSITSKGSLSLKIDNETVYFATTTINRETQEYRLTRSSEEESSLSKHSVELHVPVFADRRVEKEANVALSTVITWVQTSQKSTTTTTTASMTYRYGVFPAENWFFIKANTKGGDSLVLAVKNASTSEGANLVLKNLSFKDYKSQLWTFRNGSLVNYGSKLVIDVHEHVKEYALIKQSAEAGVGTQKWSLTAEGRIKLDSYNEYTLGISQSSTLVEDTEIVLIQYSESKSNQAITWKFSVPVFAKKAIQSGTSMASAVESVASSIEKGSLIETIEEVKFKVEEVFAKKPKRAPSKAPANAPTKHAPTNDKEEHHDVHDILSSVGIVAGAVAAGTAVIGVTSKLMDKLNVDCDDDVKKDESGTKLVASHKKKDTKSAVTDKKKATETVVVRRSHRTSAQIIQESQAIVRAWKIVFSQRIHRCTSKTQLIETIEESQEELFRRLDEHVRVYTSVEHMISGSVPQWHVSIQQVKELYRARVFESFLDRLHHEEINSSTELEFDTVLASATEEVERHYESVIEEQKKIQTEVSTNVQGVTEASTESNEVDVHEQILLTVDTIKVKVRYWLVGLYEAISVAKKDGRSEEEINAIVENSRKQLSTELSEIKTTTLSYVEKSSSTVLSSKKKSIVNTIDKAISQTETVISKQVSVISSEKHYEVNEDYWLEVTRTSDERLSSELKVYQNAITQEISEVQSSNVNKSDQAEISVVLDEKLVGVAQETVTNKIIETKTKLASWFTEITKQIAWISESSTSDESLKQDTLAIVDAAQIELATRIEETKLVLRTYYAHLTYLSWAERRRIEYSLDNIKSSLVANISHFKNSIQKQNVTKEEIIRYSNYSFGATVSRTVVLDIETIVSKVTKVKETKKVVNTTNEKYAEVKKVTDTIDKKATESTKVNTEVSKVEETQKVKTNQKIQVNDKVEAEVEKTKVTDTESKLSTGGKPSTSADKKSALTAIGAAAAAMASAAIFHHHEGKETQQKKDQKQSEVSTTVVEKPTVTQTNIVVGKNTETLHAHDQKKTSTTSKQEKSEALVVVYDQVQVTVQDWLTNLNKRVIECVQRKSDNVQEEIDTIVYESQQELVVAIEKAKRTTTSVIGTSQTSFHDALAWVRSTVWTQTAEIKRVAQEVATSSETNVAVLEERLTSIKETTLSKVTQTVEESKKSATAFRVVDHKSSATIAAGKKFEGVDYSKTSHGEYVEKTKVSVGILIEETRSTVQRTLNQLAVSISERRKQGGDNVQSDIEAIIEKSRSEITDYIQRSKTEFEKRITHTSQVNESSNKVQVELVNETNKKVQTTLEQIQESVLVQVSRVEEVTTTVTSTKVTDVEYTEKLTSTCHEAYEKVNAALSVSETIIGHHVEVVAESATTTVEHTATQEDSKAKKVSLGVEYGLVVVSEATKSVSNQLSQLIERVHHSVINSKETVEKDVKTIITESDTEIDRLFDQAKSKIEYELSMVSSHEKVEEEHFLAVIEELRTSAKKRVTQIHEVAVTKKEESKTVSERLLQIAEESRHEVSSHFDSLKKTVVESTEKVKDSVHQGVSVTRPSSGTNTQVEEKEEDNESKIDLAKKVLAGSAAVAAGAAIAVEVAKKVAAHKEKVEQEEKTKQETVAVVEDVKVQFNKWISTLTETVVNQTKQSQVSQEEITKTIEKSKTEFLEVIQKAKTSTVITEKHQQEVLSWVEQTAVSQATRIQEIAVSSSTSTEVDVESRLEVLKISTTQEIGKALEKVKEIKSTTTKFVGSTVDQLRQKESALLDVKSELSIVIQDVKTSVVTFFKNFTSSVVTRVEKGGDNVAKDVSVLVADTRKKVSTYIENVKNTATKKLSALENKPSASTLSVAALSGIATAELIAVLKSTEETLVQKINHVHSAVWRVEKDQDTTEIIQSVTTIEKETTIEISEKIEQSHYGFVTGISEHHQAGHISTSETDRHDVKEVEKTKKVDTQTVVTVDYIKTTVHSWLEELMVETSEIAKREHDVTKVTNQINSVVNDYKEFITAELDVISKKAHGSKNDSGAVQELVNIIEWTRGMVLQSTAQIQQIGVNSAVSFNSTGGIDQMRSLISATETQIQVALERCNKTVKIDVELKTSHYEKHVARKEYRKQERVKFDNEKKVKSEEEHKKKKIEEAKKIKKAERAELVKKAKEAEKAKKAEEGHQSDTDSSSDSESDSETSDSDNSDSEDTKIKSKRDNKKILAGSSALSVSVIVREWYEKLIVDVSSRAKQGGSHVDSDIETIVNKATRTVTEKLQLLGENAHKSLVDVSTVQQYRNSIEWAKNLVIQSSYQIKAIGVNSAISATSKTGGIEQMRPIAISIQEQIDVEIRRYKLITEKQQSTVSKVVKKVESKPVSSIEHKKNTQKVSTIKSSIVARKEYREKLQKHVTESVSESKTVVLAWFAQVVQDVSIRVHQGGNNVDKDIAVIIKQSKAQLDETLKRTQTKFVSSIGVYEEDETFTTIESEFQKSLKVVQSTVEKKVTQVLDITIKCKSESEITEKLSDVLESSKVEVTETLDTTCKQAKTIIEEETVQAESTVTIIDTVDYVKSVVVSWETKLSEQIHSITIDQTIENKEERINALVEEANSDIERVTQEAKAKVTESCQSAKKISKSKEKSILTTLDYVHETFTSDVKKVHQVSVEAVKKSETNIKDSVSSILQSSRNKIDTFLTRTAVVVTGAATAAMAIHAINKKQHEEEKSEKKKSKSQDDWSLNAQENVKAISQWFELFTTRVSDSVRKQEGDVVQHITSVSEHAQQEVSEIITAARNDFIKRLSHENMDQEAYDYAVKHYEESLESARVSILTEVTEVKKIAIEAHKAGKTEVLDVELSKKVIESTERIKVAMGSSVSITHKTQSGKKLSSVDSGAVLQIEVKDDQEIVGEQGVEFERKEESVDVVRKDKVQKEKHGSSLEKVVAGSLAIGAAAAGAAVLVHEKNKKDQKESQKQSSVLKYDTGIATIESVQVTISEWFKTLVQKVSHASKSGASSEQITVIVQESRTELTQIVEHAKVSGAAHCSSAADEQQFVSKIEWATSVALAQATQIQQIGINAAVSKSDLTSQMESLATASYHQIEVTLEQLKTTVNFHQKMNKITGKVAKTTRDVIKPVSEKATTAVDKTKVAYGVIQETRVATAALFVSLSERIVGRIRQGGVNVQEDIAKILESSEDEVVKVFENAKRTSAEVDEKTRTEIETALATVHKTVEEQITEVKTVTVEVVNSTSTDSKVAVEKVLEISKSSKEKVDGVFSSVSETITASLVVVSQTAQNATKTVQSWFSDLSEKINNLLEAEDCSDEEKQEKINTVVSEAEVEMKTKITKLQEESVEKKSTSTSEVSTDHHLDVFFGNVKASVEKQLDDVKKVVQDKNQMNTVSEKLKSSESRLKQEIDGHYEAVQQITKVDHIIGTKQQVATEVENDRHSIYKGTIEKVAVGTAAVAAAAAAAIGFHKKNQKAESTSVEVVKESSIRTVQVQVDTWLSSLTQKVVSRTKQGGESVSVDVAKIVESAQNELEVILNEAKAQNKDETQVENSRSFSHTLEWIKTTAIAQSTQITEIVSHSSSSSIDLTTQIENHVSVTKQQISHALKAHKETETSVTQSNDSKKQNIVQVVTETREQTQKRISLETTVIVQERKTEITNWLVLLLENLTTIIHSNSETIRRDIFARLELAEKELDTYIQQTKDQFLSITSSSATSKVDTETHTLITKSVKQSLDCVESIKATVVLQIGVVREIINRIEVEDIDVITERLHAVIHRTQERVHHTFDSGIELAISSAFEGKVITWSEVAAIPSSFKQVRTIAYDLAGTVVDFKKGLYKVWKRIITPKNDVVLSTLDFNTFVSDWFGAFSEIKRENYSKQHVVSDDVSLHESLVHILQRYYVKDLLTQGEIEELCEAWSKVDVHEDASVGIRRIKNQTSAKYATIAVSDTFSTSTMIDLAQNNCLCWHAQFSYDMFTASKGETASEALVQGTIRLLNLKQAHELALVSANPEIITAAKKHGCHAVLIEREGVSHVEQVKYDVKVDGLDIFGESVQSFLEHENMVQAWNDKEAPAAPIVWAQKVKGLFN
ncbi:hypothetical protein G6F28_003187 [Rhizopus arrhizus]|nr:hypothetical protein G6F28_003187 [Rhizopus arrhizus]KAG1427902.1 hypothetical protein G6F58_000818 [Rhizopus delemar]